MLLPQDIVDQYKALPKKWQSEMLVQIRGGQKTKYNDRITLIMQRREHPTPKELDLIIPLVKKYYATYHAETPEDLEKQLAKVNLKKSGGSLPIPLD